MQSASLISLSSAVSAISAIAAAGFRGTLASVAMHLILNTSGVVSRLANSMEQARAVRTALRMTAMTVDDDCDARNQ